MVVLARRWREEDRRPVTDRLTPDDHRLKTSLRPTCDRSGQSGNGGGEFLGSSALRVDSAGTEHGQPFNGVLERGPLLEHGLFYLFQVG